MEFHNGTPTLTLASKMFVELYSCTPTLTLASKMFVELIPCWIQPMASDSEGDVRKRVRGCRGAASVSCHDTSRSPSPGQLYMCLPARITGSQLMCASLTCSNFAGHWHVSLAELIVLAPVTCADLGQITLHPSIPQNLDPKTLNLGLIIREERNV
eukprot:scaffold27677_cov21-Tisochrysis_lutea.AAC.7